MIYSIKELLAEYQKGQRYKYIFFWGNQPSADGSITESCLSQWWIQDFTVNGTKYCCAEQYMMAEKARLFNDQEMWGYIMQAQSPKDMKAYGRLVKNFDKEIWDDNCYDIVKNGNRAKFSQNPELLEYLLWTGKRILVEASPRDRVWGIGMGKNNPDAENPLKWHGKNLLGFALTEVRDELRGE